MVDYLLEESNPLIYNNNNNKSLYWNMLNIYCDSFGGYSSHNEQNALVTTLFSPLSVSRVPRRPAQNELPLIAHSCYLLSKNLPAPILNKYLRCFLSFANLFYSRLLCDSSRRIQAVPFRRGWRRTRCSCGCPFKTSIWGSHCAPAPFRFSPPECTHVGNDYFTKKRQLLSAYLVLGQL